MGKKKTHELTKKQKDFADLYLGECRFNATQAAIKAGYSKKTAYSIGSENLRKPEISAYIDERAKMLEMSANEVIATLTAHARGKITDVLNDDNELDLNLARERGTDRLIRKMKIKRISKVVKEKNEDGSTADDLETSIRHEQIEFEIHDSQAALVHLGKYHKLFTDKTEVEHSGQVSVVRVPPKISPEKWRSQSEK